MIAYAVFLAAAFFAIVTGSVMMILALCVAIIVTATIYALAP